MAIARFQSGIAKVQTHLTLVSHIPSLVSSARAHWRLHCHTIRQKVFLHWYVTPGVWKRLIGLTDAQATINKKGDKKGEE